MSSSICISLFTLLLLFSSLGTSQHNPTPAVCIIGSGIGGSSVAHFLRQYSGPDSPNPRIHVFERNGVVGGRMATVTLSGGSFEAGASILHPKNYHALNFTKYLNLKIKRPSPSDDSVSLGIWDGKEFVFKTINVRSDFKNPYVQRILSFVNSVYMFVRYRFSLLRMQTFVESVVGRFLNYYESFERRPVFGTVDEMLKWAGLYNLTTRTLQDELVDAKLSPLLMQELVTVITRINYGQSISISGLAGVVSLAGSGGGLWAVEGGNWQMAAGLINQSDVALHLNEEIKSISYIGEHYELNSSEGSSYNCQVTVVATPLDELDLHFSPPILVPERKLQHTHATFIRGVLNPAYFGLDDVSKIPELVGTIEDSNLPFSSISILKQHGEKDFTYKIFSRQSMSDASLNEIFSVRKDMVRINWGAYPHYKAPEAFAPFILDGKHLYYINAFENAASTMETSAVAAENVARLIFTRFFSKKPWISSNLKNPASAEVDLHLDL